MAFKDSKTGEVSAITKSRQAQIKAYSEELSRVRRALVINLLIELNCLNSCNIKLLHTFAEEYGHPNIKY